jgi:uncharacterized protein YrrD
MRFSDAMGRKVVSTSTADTVGQIDDFVVDPVARRVVALSLKKTDTGEVLRWGAITAFGSDAVTVSGAEQVTDADADISMLLGKDHRLLGKRVLTSLGEQIGTVADVEFDADSGGITAITLHDGQVDGSYLVGVGSYAVVVRAA